MSQIAVKVNIRGAKAAFEAVKRSLSASNPDIRAGFRQATVRYSAFTRRRFNTYSRGGGDWLPLAKSTVDARRTGGKAKGGVDFGGGRNSNKARKKGSNGSGQLGRGARSSLARDTRKKGILVSAGGTFSILRDRGFLFNALTIGAAGNRVTELPNGIAFGFTDAPHGAEAELSIGQLATIHHFGVPAKGIPARPILVRPDAQTIRLIQGDLKRAANTALKKAGVIR